MKLEDANKLARSLMDEYELRSWKFEFDTAVQRFGCCKQGRRTITLSKLLTTMNEPEDVEQVIRHEIAHALVGPHHGHDQVWRKVAREIGANGDRCYPAHVKKPLAPWIGECPKCKKVIRRWAKDRKLACKACCTSAGGYSPAFWFVWRKEAC